MHGGRHEGRAARWARGARGLLTAAAALALPAGLLVAVAPPAAAATNVSYLALYSTPGDYIGQGRSQLYRAPVSRLTPNGNAGSVTVNVEGPNGSWLYVQLAAPQGRDLAPGVYPRATRAPFRNGNDAGIDISGNGRGCNSITGSFAVRDVHVGANGVVDRLWAVFEQHCEGGAAALFGEIKVNVPVDGPVVAPDAIAFPDAYPGSTSPVAPVWVLRPDGSFADVVSATLGGPAARDYTAAPSACNGSGACQVDVRFTPTASGQRSATLTLATADGTATIPLGGVGIAGRTSFSYSSGADDWVGAGQSRSYTPANSVIFAYGDASRVRVSLQGGDGAWMYADIAPPAGERLLPGTYNDAQRTTFRAAGRPG
ncbi:hypothetical protein, partial [Motilibacter deserti]